MRYIDRTDCRSMHDKGRDSEITKMGKLTRTATRIAENEGLGLLKTHWGVYRVIRSEVELCSDVLALASCERSFLHAFTETLFNCRDEVSRNCTADNGIYEFEFFCRW